MAESEAVMRPKNAIILMLLMLIAGASGYGGGAALVQGNIGWAIFFFVLSILYQAGLAIWLSWQGDIRHDPLRFTNRLLFERPFFLEAGDVIVGNVTTGDLYVAKQSGERLDLNALQIDITDPAMNLRTIDHPMQFMALTSLLAASFGLSGSTVNFIYGSDGKVFDCELKAASVEARSAA